MKTLQHWGIALITAAALAASSCAQSTAPQYAAVDSGEGTLIAASGFDVQRDGFAFRNWGAPDAQHGRGLTPAAMQSLFGDRVCTPASAGSGCVLTAVGEVSSQVFEQVSAGGHCFGMAAVAGLWHRDVIDNAPYLPTGSTVYDADPSPALDALITRYFTTQLFEPTDGTTTMSSVSDTVDELADAWNRGDDYILVFYTADKSAGHAVTPIATRDLGGGRVGIVLYDNNFPGEETMLVGNRDDDSWFYTTAADPNDDSYLFVGSPENQLGLVPLDSLPEIHDCPTCAESDGSDYVVLVSDGDPDASPADTPDPEWSLAVTDTDGEPTDTIRRSEVVSNDNTALLTAPPTTPMTLTMSDLDTDDSASIDVSILGDGWVARINSLRLDEGTTLTVTTDPLARTATISADAPTTADITVAVDSEARSRTATVRATRVDAAQPVTVGTTGDALTLTDTSGALLRSVEMR